MKTTPPNGVTPLHTIAHLTPQATLAIYTHAAILSRTMPDGSLSQYPVSPSSIAQALGLSVQLSTGLITDPNTLAISEKGDTRRVIGYRLAQVTALWLDGVDDALYAPLPPLIMIRDRQGSRTPSYHLFAVKQRPSDVDEPLFAAPMPNTGISGTCWGSVQAPADMHPNSLQPDWDQWLHTPFGNHQTAGKSVLHPKDIRKHWIALDEQSADTYPLDDLQPTRHTLKEFMEI